MGTSVLSLDSSPSIIRVNSDSDERNLNPAPCWEKSPLCPYSQEENCAISDIVIVAASVITIVIVIKIVLMLL